MSTSIKRSIVWISLSLVALASGNSPVVWAQSEGYLLEEIVVTARRRSENVKDVPGTVGVITEATIESAGIERVADFIKLTPGVSLVDAAEVGDTQVNIRGINGARDAENSFAFIVDGVLHTNPAAFNREYPGRVGL